MNYGLNIPADFATLPGMSAAPVTPLASKSERIKHYSALARRWNVIRLTLAALCIAGAGGWLFGCRIPPASMSQSTEKFLREDAQQFEARAMDSFGITNYGMTSGQSAVDNLMWEDRRRLQEPSAAVFWVCLALAYFAHDKFSGYDGVVRGEKRFNIWKMPRG